MKRYFAALFLIFSVTVLSYSPLFAADSNVAVRAEVKLFKNKIKIGDDIRVSIKVEHPRKYNVQPLDIKQNLDPFEIKKVDDKPIIRGQNRVETIYFADLTVFAVGKVELPPIKISYSDESDDFSSIQTDPVKVTVEGANKKLTDKDDIRPIKGPAPSNLQLFWNVVMSILVGILVIVLVILSVRRYLKYRLDQESRKPAHVRVGIELNRLKDKGFLEEKNYRDFYAEFTDILRRYLNRRYGIDAMDKTSTELVKDLAKYSLSLSVMEKIKSLTTETDLVKFAKFAPAYEVSQKLEALLLEIVDETKPEEKKK